MHIALVEGQYRDAPKACYNGERPDPRTPVWPYRSNQEDLVKTVVPHTHTHTHTHTHAVQWDSKDVTTRTSSMIPIADADDPDAGSVFSLIIHHQALIMYKQQDQPD